MKSPEPRPKEPWGVRAILIPQPLEKDVRPLPRDLDRWSQAVIGGEVLGPTCWLSESRESFYSANNGLASETLSARHRMSSLKIAFKGSLKKVSDLVLNDEGPEKQEFSGRQTMRAEH